MTVKCRTRYMYNEKSGDVQQFFVERVAGAVAWPQQALVHSSGCSLAASTQQYNLRQVLLE